MSFFCNNEPRDKKRITIYKSNNGQSLETRFSLSTIKALRSKFKKLSINSKMSKAQFRECMGVLGLETTSFLSDRIFATVDLDRDNYITFEEFLKIMDILTNGSEEEKHEFSFRLIDVKNKGLISYEDFCSAIKRILSVWGTMTGSPASANDTTLHSVFNKLDANHDGFIDLIDYKSAVNENSNIFGWFDLLNQNDKIEKNKHDNKEEEAIKKTQALKKEIEEMLILIESDQLDADSDTFKIFSELDIVSGMNMPSTKMTEGSDMSLKGNSYLKTLSTKNITTDNKYESFDNINDVVIQSSSEIRCNSDNTMNVNESMDSSKKNIQAPQIKINNSSMEKINTLEESLNVILKKKKYEIQEDNDFNSSGNEEELKDEVNLFNEEREGRNYTKRNKRASISTDSANTSILMNRSILDQNKQVIVDKLRKISEFTNDLLKNYKKNSDFLTSVDEEKKSNKLNVNDYTKKDTKRNSSIRSSSSNPIRKSMLHNVSRESNLLGESRSTKGFVHIGHENWNLVLNMMLGIRTSVRNVMNEEIDELTDDEFKVRYIYELVPKRGSTKNKFKLCDFYDSSPRVFNKIRNLFNIKEEDYLKSIGPEHLIGNLLMGNISTLEEQCSAGKSGSFFYYSADGKFMLKTIRKEEYHFFRKLLKGYYEHLCKNPHSLIARFYGLHKLRFQKTSLTKRIYFIIMGNVFNTQREINMRFDLKGSQYGRFVKEPQDKIIPSTVALKDINFINQGMSIDLHNGLGDKLKEQLKEDMKFFQRNQINDYSLLLGVNYLKHEEAIDLLNKSPSYEDVLNNKNILENGRPQPFFEIHEGGILSKDKTKLYFIGIIDVLTFYGKLEYNYKKVRFGKTVSCIPPEPYGERFIQFLHAYIK